MPTSSIIYFDSIWYPNYADFDKINVTQFTIILDSWPGSGRSITYKEEYLATDTDSYVPYNISEEFGVIMPCYSYYNVKLNVKCEFNYETYKKLNVTVGDFQFTNFERDNYEYDEDDQSTVNIQKIGFVEGKAPYLVLTKTDNVKPTEDSQQDETQSAYVYKIKDDDDGGLSGGAIAGIVIACIVVVGAIIGVVIFFVIRKKKNDGGHSSNEGEK